MTSGRSHADMGEKRGKVIQPFSGHRNTSLTVSVVMRVLRVVASALRGLPRPMFRTSRAAMRSRIVSSGFASEAAATLQFTGSHRPRLTDRVLSAVASTQPFERVCPRDVSDDRQAIEPLPEIVSLQISSHNSIGILA
jgi:hypothetical protein